MTRLPAGKTSARSVGKGRAGRPGKRRAGQSGTEKISCDSESPAGGTGSAESAGGYVRGMHVPGARREIRARQAQMPARKKRGGAWFWLRGGRFPLTPVRKRQDTNGAHCGRSREWKMRKVLPAPCARAFFAPAGGTGSGADGEPHCQSH